MLFRFRNVASALGTSGFTVPCPFDCICLSKRNCLKKQLQQHIYYCPRLQCDSDRHLSTLALKLLQSVMLKRLLARSNTDPFSFKNTTNLRQSLPQSDFIRNRRTCFKTTLLKALGLGVGLEVGLGLGLSGYNTTYIIASFNSTFQYSVFAATITS